MAANKLPSTSWDTVLLVIGSAATLIVAYLTKVYMSKHMTPTQDDLGWLLCLIVSALCLLVTMVAFTYRIMSRLDSVGNSVTNALEFLDHDALLGNVLLSESIKKQCKEAASKGVRACRQRYVHKLVLGDYREFMIPLPNETKHIEVLTDVVEVSQNYVYACTYATSTYLMDFWVKHPVLIDRYYAAHKRALTTDGVNVKRLFIVPDSFYGGEDEKFMPYLIKVVQDHKDKAGMIKDRHVYVVKESDVSTGLHSMGQTFKKGSFFVCDNVFTSESVPRPSGSAVYASFFCTSDDKCSELQKLFDTLLGIAAAAMDDQRVSGSAPKRNGRGEHHARKQHSV